MGLVSKQNARRGLATTCTALVLTGTAGCAALTEASSVAGECQEAVEEAYTVDGLRDQMREDPATAEWAEQLSDEQLAGLVDDPDMKAFEWALCVSDNGWSCPQGEALNEFEVTGNPMDIQPPQSCRSNTGGTEVRVENPFL